MRKAKNTGDDGSTSIISGERVMKDDDRIECLGTLDELNAFLGEVKTAVSNSTIKTLLQNIQEELFRISGAAAADWPETDIFDKAANTMEGEVKMLEQKVTGKTKSSKKKDFSVPGGSQASAKFDVARTVCRRAERRLVSLAKISPCPMGVLRYMNRLSDLLFLLARQN